MIAATLKLLLLSPLRYVALAALATAGLAAAPVAAQAQQVLVIVNGDHDGDSYLVALDQQTGETVWKVDRAHKIRSYVTPLIRTIDALRSPSVEA